MVAMATILAEYLVKWQFLTEALYTYTYLCVYLLYILYKWERVCSWLHMVAMAINLVTCNSTYSWIISRLIHTTFGDL